MIYFIKSMLRRIKISYEEWVNTHFSAFLDVRKHDDLCDVLLPYHPPKIIHCVGSWTWYRKQVLICFPWLSGCFMCFFCTNFPNLLLCLSCDVRNGDKQTHSIFTQVKNVPISWLDVVCSDFETYLKVALTLLDRFHMKHFRHNEISLSKLLKRIAHVSLTLCGDVCLFSSTSL